MPDRTIKLEEAEQLFDELQSSMKQAALRGLVSAAQRLVQEIVLRIIPSKTPQPVDRGIFRAGWRAYPEVDGATIENLETHAAFIEWGVRGENVKIGSGMIEAIREWILRKGIADPDEATRVAFAIAVTARKFGIFHGGQGFRILESALKLAPDIMREEIENEIRRL